MIEVRVQPRAGRNSVSVTGGAALRVQVTAAAEGGSANEAVIGLLSKELGVAKSRIRIVRGHRARDKVLEVEGLSAEDAVARVRSRRAE